MLKPKDCETWTDFRDSTGPSLPINSAIGSFPFHPWTCYLFTTFSRPSGGRLPATPPIEDAKGDSSRSAGEGVIRLVQEVGGGGGEFCRTAVQRQPYGRGEFGTMVGKPVDDVHTEAQAEDRGLGIVLKLLIQEFCGGFERVLPSVGAHLIEHDGNGIQLASGDRRGRGGAGLGSSRRVRRCEDSSFSASG